jgi:hypothetical protein
MLALLPRFSESLLWVSSGDYQTRSSSPTANDSFRNGAEMALNQTLNLSLDQGRQRELFD